VGKAGGRFVPGGATNESAILYLSVDGERNAEGNSRGGGGDGARETRGLPEEVGCCKTMRLDATCKNKLKRCYWQAYVIQTQEPTSHLSHLEETENQGFHLVWINNDT